MAIGKVNHTSFLNIEKRDDAQQIVEGYASSENIDQQPGMWEGQAYEGDVVEAQAIRKALPEYMEWANVHEMHNDGSAIGTILKAEVISGEVELSDGRKLLNPLHVIAHIVDPLAWEKVVTGVYKGFSIQANVFKLKLAKVAGRLVRLIQSLQLTEISLVDRPANPGARILLWKGSNMAKQNVSVSKAGDPQKAVAMLQELRNACELEGDLEAAGNYTNAIALVMQGLGADVEVVAEDEEATEEHAALGEPAPDEGSAEVIPDVEDKEQPTADELDKGLNTEQSDDEKRTDATEADSIDAVKEDGDKMATEKLKDSTTKKSASTRKAGPAIEVISKAEFITLSGKVDEISKALSGDIARLVKGIEDLSERVDGLQMRPVLHELPANGINDQPVQILKGMLKEISDPATREILGHRIAEMEIRTVQPNFVGYIR